MPTVRADLRAARLDILLTEASYTSLPFQVEGQDWTGYTLPLLRVSQDRGETFTDIAGTFDSDIITFNLDSAQWVTLVAGCKWIYQVEYTNPDGKRVIEVTGDLEIEGSMS